MSAVGNSTAYPVILVVQPCRQFRSRHFSLSPGESSDMPTARTVAWDVLTAWQQRQTYIAESLESLCHKASLTPADRRLAYQLCHGVVRRQGTLDAILRPLVSRGLENVEPGLLLLMRLGTYQLVFLTQVPPHAAVHATVELTKYCRKPQWEKILNGVLRGVTRCLTTDFESEPSERGIPCEDGRYRLLTTAAFPAPQRDPVGYLAEAFSFPRWLPQRWQVRMSNRDLFQLGFWFNAVPALCLRVNLLRTSRSQLLERFTAAGIECRTGHRPESLWLSETRRVEDLPGFATGDFAVQDESAMAAAALLAPQSGERVLDLCAAPGGKTSHLAELMRNQGEIVAADVAHEKLALIVANCRRQQFDIVRTELLNREIPQAPAGSFPAVLVDAPCSNTGVLGKRPEVRWRLRPEEFGELKELQLQLLTAAAKAASHPGRIVYSTCSIEPEENRAVVESFLAQHLDWTLQTELEHRPGLPADGGYQALLARR